MSSSILRFWGVGVRSWRNFLLLLIAVREFEDSDFLLRVQMVLLHYAWRLNNVFWEWMFFRGDIKPGQMINSLPVEKSYLIEKQFLSQSATLFLMNTHQSEYAFFIFAFLICLHSFLIRYALSSFFIIHCFTWN